MNYRVRLRAGAWLLPCVLLASCSDILSGDDNSLRKPPGATGGNGADAQAAAPPKGSTRIRRLTVQEYEATLRDILKLPTAVPVDVTLLPPDTIGLHGYAANIAVTRLAVERYTNAAETLAKENVARLSSAIVCDVAKEGEEGCAKRFIGSVARRAYKRDLTQDDVTDLVAIYQSARKDRSYDHAGGLRMVTQTILQSPYFLYRTEQGPPGTAPDATKIKLTQFELAARLSYFLWSSAPDDALLDAAAKNELTTPDQIGAQATRLLADKARSAASVESFHRQWLKLDKLSDIAKLNDGTPAFPLFDSNYRRSMLREALAFVNHVILDGDGTFGTLLTAPFTFVDDRMAKFYGLSLPSGADPNVFAKVDVDPAQRAGLLTQGSVMSVFSNPYQSSPVKRGLLIRERFLCQTVLPPPAGANTNPPTPEKVTTTREQFATILTRAECKGCHEQFDPIGYGFESFDAFGRFRSTENAKPIDASGALTGTDVDGAFNGAPGLAARLAKSDLVKACVVKQYFRYAFGRPEVPADQTSLDALTAPFKASGNIRDLLVAIAKSETFSMRPEGTL